jgi:hypothetical protein
MLKLTIGPPTHHTPSPTPAEFVEYPKWLHFAGKPSVIVNDREEEKAALSGNPLQAAPEPVRPIVNSAPVQTLQGVVDERASLLTIAEARGIKIDKRWKTEKIRRTIEAAVPTE